jgi:Domain of unknown function (DUF4376)
MTVSILRDGVLVDLTDAEAAAMFPPPPAEPPPTLSDLIAYAAAARYNVETSGITVSGIKIATDRDSQALITGAWAMVQQTPTATIQWKGSDGSWTTINAAQITGIAMAVSTHVQTCFSAEQACDTAINAVPPTITTTAQIDAVMAAITA